MAWLTLRNDHLLLDLCPDLKNASFETLGAKVAELGLTLDFDIAAELAQIEAKKRRSSVKTSARSALRQKIHWALGAGLKRRSNGRNERQQAALLRCSRLRTVGEPIRDLRHQLMRAVAQANTFEAIGNKQAGKQRKPERGRWHDPVLGRWLGLTPEQPALHLRGSPRQPRVDLSRHSDPPGPSRAG